MTRPEAMQRQRQVQTAPSRRGPSGIVAALVFVVAMAALAQVALTRAVVTLDASRGSTWQLLMKVGDDARARGDVPGARRAYLSALFRARGEHALAGVLSAAEGFESLGDRPVVEQALRVAATLDDARVDADTTRRLRALRDRLDAPPSPPMAIREVR
jgi:hypothetical protein